MGDPELKPMFEDIKKNGPDVLMKYLQDEAIVRKVSQKLGGISPEMTKALMQIKDSNGKDFKGVTPLGYAVGHDQLSCVKVLIDMKANLNEVDSAGNSAVHFAAGYGRVKVLEHLLARGANASKVNQMGMTPMAAAQQNNQQQAMALLQRHGAK